MTAPVGQGWSARDGRRQGNNPGEACEAFQGAGYGLRREHDPL